MLSHLNVNKQQAITTCDQLVGHVRFFLLSERTFFSWHETGGLYFSVCLAL